MDNRGLGIRLILFFAIVLVAGVLLSYVAYIFVQENIDETTDISDDTEVFLDIQKESVFVDTGTGTVSFKLEVTGGNEEILSGISVSLESSDGEFYTIELDTDSTQLPNKVFVINYKEVGLSNLRSFSITSIVENSLGQKILGVEELVYDTLSSEVRKRTRGGDFDTTSGGSSNQGGSGGGGGGGSGGFGGQGGSGGGNSGPPPFDILLISPAETTYGYTELLLNFTITGTAVRCWYDLDSLNNVSIANCLPVYFNTSEGNHTLIVYAQSDDGRIESDSADFIVEISDGGEGVCGNGIIEVGEVCDLNSQSCQINGYNGMQNCLPNCLGYGSCVSNEFCGDGIQNGNEQCDDGDTDDGDGCSAICQIEIQSCNLISAGWDRAFSVEGEKVDLNVVGENCNGQEISFVVWEDDTIGDDPVSINPVNVNFVNDIAVGSWITEWQDDGLGDPEYYFIASLTSQVIESVTSDPPQLIVSQFVGNNPPILSPIGNKVVNEQQILQFTLNYTDPEGDVVSCLPAQNLPLGALFNTGTCTFSWTPGSTQSGNYNNIIFTIEDDGGLQDSESINITVLDSGGQQFTLLVTKSGSGGGTVTSLPIGINCGSDCSEPYNSGTLVSLTATANSSSRFIGWNGACSGNGSCQVTMTSNRNVNAQFNISTGVAQCADGTDNDLDGSIDLADFSCSNAEDNDETNPEAQCQDGFDNDGDTLIDLNDSGCSGNQDNDEFNFGGGGGSINIDLDASRTTCVAPCGIFFDASGTNAPSTNKPFHELHYEWNFDDGASGSWAVTGKSKNVARGPIAAHVFESSGSYDVSLSVSDEIDSNTEEITINVQNPNAVFSGTNTICFSQSGDFNGCPSGAQQVITSSYSEVTNRIATGKRLLLRRGETWSASNFNMQHPGPGMIGAFGICQSPDARGICSNNPVLNGGSFRMAPGERVNQNDVDTYDWRFVDLVFTGTTGSSVFDTQGEFRDLNVIRVKSFDTENFFGFSPAVIRFWNVNEGQNHDLPSRIFVVDSDLRRFLGGGGNNGYYVGAYELATLGTSIMDSTGAEHIVRFPHVERMIFSNNYAENPSNNKHIIKLHAPKWDGSNSVEPGRYGQKIIISDNVLRGRTEQEILNFRPQNTDEDERVRDVIFEGNHMFGSSTTIVMINIGGENITIRNNIFDHSGMPGGRTINVERRGAEPNPRNVEMYENTIYTSATNDLDFVRARASAINTIVKNNLAYGPSSGEINMVINEGSQNLVQSNNLAILDPPSPFVSSNPSDADDYLLHSTSPAIDFGINVPVFGDFNGERRPSGDSWDAGGYEFDLGLSPEKISDKNLIERIRDLFSWINWK